MHYFCAGERADKYVKIAILRKGRGMAEAGLFEEIDRRMREILAHSPAADLEKNLRALLASAFARLDLVTREEFDVQREVLARTRAKLEALEAKLAELEQRLQQPPSEQG
jgi:BMFP domain-containing protein YqiC